MSIRKDRKRGAYEVVVRVRVGLQKRMTQRREWVCGTLDQAKSRELAIKQELKAAAPDYSSLKMKTFSEALEFYVTHSNTPPTNRYTIDRLKRELGHVKVTELLGPFNMFLLGLRKQTSANGRPYRPGSINKFITWAKSALYFCIEKDVLITDVNPLAWPKVKKLKCIPRDEVLNEDEKVRFLAAIDEFAHHLWAIARFLLQVPCRKSELVNLRRVDVDLINNCVRIRNGQTKEDHGLTKPIPPDLIPYFRSIPIASEWAFYRYNATTGQYNRLGDFKKAWATCRKKAGIGDFRIHDCRHVAATNAINNGTPEKVVEGIAGWRSNMLKDYYHRDGVASLKLFKFAPDVTQRCDTSDSKVG